MELDRFRAMRIPSVYKKARFKDFKGIATQIEEAKAAIKDGKSVTLWGSPGTGKTELGVCLMQSFLHNVVQERGDNKYDLDDLPVFYTYTDMMAELRASNDPTWTGQATDALLHRPKTSKLILIDDFGKGKVSEFTDGKTYELVATRYNNELPMIVTTNLEPGEMAERFDEAICSRLYGMGMVINLGNTDWRLKK